MMRKLNPQKAEDNPLAASILAAVLVKGGRRYQDLEQEKAGMELLQIAEQNKDKMPTLQPNSKLAKAIKAQRPGLLQGYQPRQERLSVQMNLFPTDIGT